MVSEHITPGPWCVGAWTGQCHKKHPGHQGHPGPGGEDGCVYEYHLTIATDTDCYMPGIAGPSPEQMVVDTHYDSLSIRLADARAISAVPEMIAALRASWALGHKIYHNANAHEADVDWPKVRELTKTAFEKAGVMPW